jgi:hypothetical protein
MAFGGLTYRAQKSPTYLVSTHARQIVHCHLLLRGNRWMPVSVNRRLGSKDRCNPDHAVHGDCPADQCRDGRVTGSWQLESSISSVKSLGMTAHRAVSACPISVWDTARRRPWTGRLQPLGASEAYRTGMARGHAGEGGPDNRPWCICKNQDSSAPDLRKTWKRK